MSVTDMLCKPNRRGGYQFPGIISITPNELEGRGWGNFLHQASKIHPRRNAVVLLELELGEAQKKMHRIVIPRFCVL